MRSIVSKNNITKRNRITTNKIEQQKTQNKVIQTKQIRPKKVKHIAKPRTSDDPASKIMLGMSNTIQDYGGIVQGDYVDKSILNQAIGHVFEGKWDKAGQVIQENPYRFAGNIAVEAGTFLIPVGGVLKATKITKLATKVLQHKTIAPVVSTVTKTVKPITNIAEKVINKVIPTKTTTTIYSIRPHNTSPNPWNSPKPNEYYFEKVTSKLNSGPDGGSGIAQIRSVEVPNQIAKDFSVENILSVLPKVPVYKHGIKVSKFKGFTNNVREVLGELPKRMHNPNQIGPIHPGELPLSKFYRTVTKQEIPNDVIRDVYNYKLKRIAAEEVRDRSHNTKNEYFLPIIWQNTEKVVATAGKKVSWVNRLLNPQYSNDQVTNALVKINKKQGNTTSLNSPGGELISKSRKISKIPQQFVMADDILKSGVPNPGFMSPLMYGTNTAKTIASGANSNDKRVDKNAGTFGGYGQFL